MLPLRAVGSAAALVIVGAALGGVVHSLLLGPVHAQALVEGDDDSPQHRERLYQLLEEEVKHLEHEATVLKSVVKLVSPTVVHIEAKKREPPKVRGGRPQSIDEAGSGVIIDYNQRLYVLTNRHVIKDAALADIGIHLTDARELHPTQVWLDPDTDVAVMAIAETDVYAARLGNSDSVEIGDFVLAVGSPFGLSHSVTYGIISAKGRRDLQLGDDSVRFQDFMQTDAAINPGNSGGPLLNLRGEVIGINTAIASSSGGNEGIGFSIPVNMVMIIARQLIERGYVARAFLGVNLDSKFTPALARELGLPRRQGARITGITPASPASAAQLRIGDVVLEFNGIRIEDDNHLVNLVSLTEVEKEVPVVILRDRQRVNLMVKVGDRKKFEQQRSQVDPARFPGNVPVELALRNLEVWDFEELGLSVGAVSPELAKVLSLDAAAAGLIVADVDPRGPLASQVRRGEIIETVNQQPVRSMDDLDRILSQRTADQPVRLQFFTRSAPPSSSRNVAVVPQSTIRR